MAGLAWPLPEDLDDAALDALLYPPLQGKVVRPEPDYAAVYRRLKDKGVTKQLAWMEYRESHPDGFEYSRFCSGYRDWAAHLHVRMRQTHRAGEKLFIDYAGHTIGVTDGNTGEVTEMQVFVAALGASNFTYAELHSSQDLHSWIGGHVRVFEYMGGVPMVCVPDNLKAGVTKACFYEPDTNRTYLDLAKYYDTVVIPTRTRKPRDKAIAENAVQQVERWVLAPLRKQTYHSLGELKRAFAERLEWLNNRKFSKLDATRRSLWEEIDRPALKSLPKKRHEITQWKTNMKVSLDYHLEFDGHYYSVPYKLAKKRVDVRATATTIECLQKEERVALHLRSTRRGHTTVAEHMPSSHRRHAEWTPSRIIAWGNKTGEKTALVVTKIMDRKPHPEQGFRACMGLLRLGKKYGAMRLEAPCVRASLVRSFSYQSVNSILKAGLDRQLPPTSPPTSTAPTEHENLRGAETYQ